jgi:hypothetical protein
MYRSQPFIKSVDKVFSFEVEILYVLHADSVQPPEQNDIFNIYLVYHDEIVLCM